MNTSDSQFLVTCEHGGREVPAEFADAFAGKEAHGWLESHRGYDPGSLAAARQIASALAARLVASTTTRLLVDLNRSLASDTVFSKFTRGLPAVRQQTIIDEYYTPYRASVSAAIESIVTHKRAAVHFSVHTFTPRITGKWRPYELGLLYDPAAELESAFCSEWKRRIAIAGPQLRTRLNEPYAGTDDGLTTTLRRRFAPSQYLGIEIEINNRLFKHAQKRQQAMVATLIQQLPEVTRVV